MPTLIIFDAAGREIAREEAKGNYKRISMAAAAQQRQLKAMGEAHPAWASATIGNNKFVFDRTGYPMWTGFGDDDGSSMASNLAARADIL